MTKKFYIKFLPVLTLLLSSCSSQAIKQKLVDTYHSQKEEQSVFKKGSMFKYSYNRKSFNKEEKTLEERHIDIHFIVEYDAGIGAPEISLDASSFYYHSVSKISDETKSEETFKVKDALYSLNSFSYIDDELKSTSEGGKINKIRLTLDQDIYFGYNFHNFIYEDDSFIDERSFSFINNRYVVEDYDFDDSLISVTIEKNSMTYFNEKAEFIGSEYTSNINYINTSSDVKKEISQAKLEKVDNMESISIDKYQDSLDLESYYLRSR